MRQHLFILLVDLGFGGLLLAAVSEPSDYLELSLVNPCEPVTAAGKAVAVALA